MYETHTTAGVHVNKQAIRKSQHKDSSGELRDSLIVKQLGQLQLSHLLNRRVVMWGYYCHCVGKLVAIKAQQKIRALSQAGCQAPPVF